MASNYLAKYLKAGGGGQLKVGTSFSSTMSNNVSASVAKNASGSIQNFAKIGKDMYIHTDDVGKIAKGAHGAGVATGRTAGYYAGAQKGQVIARNMTSGALKTGFRTGIGVGARAMLGPAAIAGGAAMHFAGKGLDRAKSNPGFHKGKAGKSYLDLSTNKSGKYGIDY
jgi:hypothetical protein